MIKEFASFTSFSFKLSKNANLHSRTFTGAGFQFSLTPSIINTFLSAWLYVKVKGKGPAKRLASFQSENGELSAKEISSLLVFSISMLKPDLIELMKVIPF